MVRRAIVILAAGLVVLAGFTSAVRADLVYFEHFSGVNGAPWPSPWTQGSSHVTVKDQQNGRARLNGDPAFVARMLLPVFPLTDVEVTVTFEFEDVANQGIGFYVRQNGGTLREYLPHGQGYALFLKGAWYWTEDLGLWREIDGIETQFAWGNNPVAGGLQNGTRYRLRYRVSQVDAATTRLRAKVWPEAQSEPAAWTLEATDAQSELQGTSGTYAIDIYNYSGFQHIFIDDLFIQPFPISQAVTDPARSPFLALSAPTPHPVTGRASLPLSLPEAAHAELRLYDSVGRMVAHPYSGPLSAGANALMWDPVDRSGHRLPPGVYFMSLTAEGRNATRRIAIAH